MRLQTRYSIILTAMILAVLLLLGSLLMVQVGKTLKEGMSASSNIMQKALTKELERGGHSINYVLANNLSNPVYSFDTNEMYEQLQSVLTLPIIEYVTIYGPDGAIIHDGEEEISRFGRIPQDPFIYNSVTSEESLIQKSDHIMDVSQPLYIGSERLGGVRIGFSLEGMTQDISQMRSALNQVFEEGILYNLLLVGVISLVAVLLLGMVMAAFVSRTISRPIHLLASYANSVGQGSDEQVVALAEGRRDELGELSRALKEMVDRLKESNERASYQAKHDHLTGLPNRFLFKEFLEHAVSRAQREQRRLAVMFIDLDDFKRINDTLGHAAGDELLQQFAQRLKSCLRSSDFLSYSTDLDNDLHVARLGGDEFIILLDNVCDSMAASIIAARILLKTRHPFKLTDGHEVVVGASIGITLYPEDGACQSQLLSNADMAMYSAKSQGKNNFVFFKDSMNTHVQQRLMLEKELRIAIEKQQFELFYQPLFDGKSNRIIGMEALVRWFHGTKGFISPADFIPVAEETGLIDSLGHWILTTACKQLKFWQQHYQLGIYCAVNVSGVQLRNRRFANEVAQILNQVSLSAESLHIELTETALLTNEEEVQEILEALQKMGIDIWMDDFGTGYSSLSFLKKFCVQGVKVDRSFVQDMETNEESQGIVSAVLAMAKSLKLQTTAEGVETKAQCSMLKEQGCDVLQGYLLGKPMPASQLDELMSAQPELFVPLSGCEITVQ